MATKDKVSSLLSKMATFVRNPTTDWSELSVPEPEPKRESVHAELALAELNKLRRKSDFVRRQDFVRRREFDYLRKLRRKGPLVGSDITARPSLFRVSTISNLDEKALTLKKIDEIETQMSTQWWQGKPGEAAVHGDHFPVAADRRRAMDKQVPTSVAIPAEINAFALAQTFEPSLKPDRKQGTDFETTLIGTPAPGDSTSSAAALPRVPGSSKNRRLDSALSEFSNSRLLSAEFGDVPNDPDLEEAAIRFANGDDSGAESVLLAVLQASEVPSEASDAWACALFDLYRATGQQASFDHFGIYIAQRFGRSAPVWFSTPDSLERKQAGLPSTRTDDRSGHVNEDFSSTQPLGDWQSLPDEVAKGNPVEVDRAGPGRVVPDALPAAVVELTGEVSGDAADVLNQLEAGLKENNRLVISCARLIRVDFSAAGNILNWISAHQSEGCQVQFCDVPRLVAAFFNVIGINEYAQVRLRTN